MGEKRYIILKRKEAVIGTCFLNEVKEMPTFQTYNKKTKAWVKYKKLKNGKSKIVNVKQVRPATPFKGVKKLGRWR